MKKFYYSATAYCKGKMIEGVPVFGFTTSSSKEKWESNDARHDAEFKQTLDRIYGAREFSMVIPQIRAIQNFPVKTEIRKLRIYYANSSSNFVKTNSGSMAFFAQGDFSVTDLMVTNSSPIKQIAPLTTAEEYNYLSLQSLDLVKPVLITLRLLDHSDVLFNDKSDY